MVVLVGMGERMAERFLPICLLALFFFLAWSAISLPATNLIVAFAFGVLGTIAFARYGTDVRLPAK